MFRIPPLEFFMDPNIGATDSPLISPNCLWRDDDFRNDSVQNHARCFINVFTLNQTRVHEWKIPLRCRKYDGGNGTTGHPTQRCFASDSGPTQPISESAKQQLCHGSQQYPGSSFYMGGNGATGLNHTLEHSAFGSDVVAPGSGLVQDIVARRTAANQPAKKRKRKTPAESSKDYRERQKAMVNGLKSKVESLHEENEAAKRELDDSNRKADALHKELLLLKAAHAGYKELVTQQQNPMQGLIKVLQDEIARLQEQHAMLQGETKGLRDLNNGLMQKHRG